jgi:hypothetical protein
MDYLFTSESIISFFVLVILEIVLGIDNVIFRKHNYKQAKYNKGSKKSTPHVDAYWYNFPQLVVTWFGLVAFSKGKSNIYFV